MISIAVDDDDDNDNDNEDDDDDNNDGDGVGDAIKRCFQSTILLNLRLESFSINIHSQI